DLPGQADFDDGGLFPMASGAVGAARRGEVRAAALQWRLVLEALDHPQTPRQRAAVREAARAWLYIGTYYLMDRPDGRVLADARRRGESLVNALLAKSASADAASALHDLGVLLSEPYVMGRDKENFFAQTASWLARGQSNAINLELPGEQQMPSPPEALADAAELFQRAADLRSGRERGRSLKAMTDALIWQSVDGPRDRDRIASALAEAYALLDPVEDEVVFTMIAQNADALGIALPDRGSVVEPDEAQLDRLKRDDPEGYFHAVTQVASRAAAPRVAIEHLLHGLRFAADIADEDAMGRLMMSVATRAIALFNIRAFVPATDASTETWTAAIGALNASVAEGPQPQADQALALLGFAVLASEADREDISMAALGETHALDVSDQPGLDVALTTALAQLSWHHGATHFKAGRFVEACVLYLTACHTATTLGMPSLARRNFERAMQAYHELSDKADPRVVSAAAAFLPRVQSEVPDVSRSIRDFWLLLISHACWSSQDEVLPVALQAAKGASLVAARSAHAIGKVLAQRSVRTALSNWRDASSEGVESELLDFDAESLLVANADSLQEPGSSAEEQRLNLGRTLDRILIAELAKGAPADSPTALDTAVLCGLLPPGSVLLSMHTYVTEKSCVGYVTMLATQEGVVVRSIHGQLPYMEMQIDHVSSDDLAGVVSALRRGLIAGGEVGHDLERAFEYAFGAVEDEQLALHRRGYRHLCVNPHGALHFCPLPLLGRAGRPLADDWIVTHLPAIGLLARDHAPASAELSGGAVFALSFDDATMGLPPLPAAADEARRIGEAMGVTPFIDQEATVERFNESLQTCRWIHVATHGRHDPRAPALQTLYLHSGRHHAVPYRAFEVLQHRLAGLDLVTLSACETALGRLDMNDNPRGLQAFLFTAGVATVISCLWPVADDAAAAFFERLYQQLAEGRTKLEAFAAAQHHVRQAYPDLIDWGAFHYSGAW
ncbi:MAG: CHAT domain-containing protein, partial [Gemmatimonadaceae bacterium]